MNNIKFIFNFILFTKLLLLFNGCSSTTSKTLITDKAINKSNNTNKSIEFVQHDYVSQKGEVLNFKEWYVRMSVQDYFIKWCSSKVKQEEIEALLAKETGIIKTLKVNIEIKDGDWDNCDTDVRATSRTGKYAIILSVLE